MNDQQISRTSKNKFKDTLKKLIYDKAFEDLMNKKETHSKMHDLTYDKLKLQNYLKTDCNMKKIGIAASMF